MNLNTNGLRPDRDLTLIFERDDVRDAFAGHCARTHADDDAVRTCTYCMGLRLALANAILEWLGIVEQSRAAAQEDEARNLVESLCSFNCDADGTACTCKAHRLYRLRSTKAPKQE